MIRGVVFDKDGTLFDFHASWGDWAAGFLSALSDDPGDLAQAIGFDLATRRFAPDSPAIAGTPEGIAARLLPHLPGRTMPDLVAQMNHLAAEAPMVPAADLPTLLEVLAGRGLRLGVATNDAAAPARRHLSEHGILGRFDFVAGFDSGHGAKPGPGQLLAFCRAVGLDPAEVAMVGDSAHDLQAGRAAGMLCVGVLTGPARRDDLLPLADAVLDDIGGLPDWLDGL
ncbi:HAD family hydrolase [Falsirhodobacter algicola]|uniref:phosphoglycolate phosphatase n=1 Tax=Falsirhodobacter algicola TaxID=2692330 RepID=A0A8J8SJX5_9RHOB|nr:HAD family hydrolase [Falsirhodobacter algicola]QUS34799.1 HAD-IA family hydrolase [Falsirhodobacter algicola]